ncbi:MAG: penicillin-binding protein 2 [bacterium]|jgi:penicillin-binding protein 2
MVEKTVNKRMNVYQTVIMLLLAVLLVRLGLLQLWLGETYAGLAEGNRIRIVPVVAARGSMYDRDGEILVTSRPAYTVSIMLMDLENTEQVVGELSELLQINKQTIMDEIAKRQKQQRLYEPIRLKVDIDEVTHTRLEERRSDLPGVVIEVEPVRNYPLGEAIAHVVGYVGASETSNRIEGKKGLEKQYDTYLQGEDGGKQVEVNARGTWAKVIGQQDPVPGSNLTLTIDADLQAVAAEALATTMEKVRNNPGEAFPNAKTGAVVAIDPRTGEVLAMVSLPAYDPNKFAVGLSHAEWNALNDPVLRPLINRAAAAAYPPGSVFKPVTATAALEEGVTTPAEKIYDTGTFRIAGARCWVRSGHGWVDLNRAIAVSCNFYFYEMGTRLGVDKIAEYARQFGLGRPTGIDLDDDRAGTLPTVEWKADRFDQPWWPGETIYAAIGQGYHAYTPLQLANYAATLANGGILYRPYLVKSITDSAGAVVKSFGPEIVGRVDATPETLAHVQQGMVTVTQPGGTAYWAFHGLPYQVAAKTGTAQNSSGDDHGVFIAYAPAENPQIAVAVLVEQGGHGSTTGGPVARAIFDEYFAAQLDEANAEKLDLDNLNLPVGGEE